MAQWLWQSSHWPNFSWQAEQVRPVLARCQLRLGKLSGLAGAEPEALPTLDTLLTNILTSNAIEGEALNAQSVRSSLAHQLGLTHEAIYPRSKRSEGVAALLLDALEHASTPLTKAMLCQWHSWLFMDEDGFLAQKIRVGQLRGHEPMQVVSGRLDNPKVHYEAVPRGRLELELNRFVQWFNQTPPSLDGLLRAALVHLWFVSIHPFDDGNGRLTRALTDKSLAQHYPQQLRLLAMSNAILADRKNYYRVLEHTQKIAAEEEPLDVTAWLVWFLTTLEAAANQSIATIERTVYKTRFWRQHQHSFLNAEQIKVLNRMLDGDFSEGINASQYQAVTKASKATATRHLTDLLDKGVFEQRGGGRSTRYVINF
ncbi:MAG: hypothetical protein RL217_1163 [Pseudomonadota bacterium]